MDKKGNGNYTFRAAFACALLLCAALASGCGGGGGGAASSPAIATAPGNGLITASVTFAGPPRGRVASVESGGILITVTVTGVYSKTGQDFPAKTATLSIPYNAAARMETLSLEVPIGVNHLIQARADYPGGGSETVRGVIDEVAEGAVTSVTVNKRTTVIADAAVAYAAQNGKRLADLDSDDISRLASAVDTLYSAGTAYSDMNSADVIEYAFGNTAGIAATIEITPATATLAVGATQTFTAAVKNAFGVTIGTDVAWSADAAIGAVGADGLFTASAAGSGVVTAATGTVTATAPVSVVPLGDVVSTAISPASVPALDAEQGDILTFTLTGTDAYGNSAAVSGASWSGTAGLSATGNPGEFSVVAPGEQTVTATYNGISASVSFTTYEAPPVAQSPQTGAITFGESYSGQFSAVGGTAPFTYSVSSGKLPLGWSLNASTGMVSGVMSIYVSAFYAYVRITDALGRSTDQYTDGGIGFTLSVNNEINEFINTIQAADGALNAISGLLQNMMNLAYMEQSSSCGGTGACNPDYQTLITQIDDIVAQATFNGMPLLDGTYSAPGEGVSVALSGGASPTVLEALISSSTAAALGVASTSLVSPSTATAAIGKITTAIAAVNNTRANLGAKQSAAEAVINSYNTLVAYMPETACLQNMERAVSLADLLLGDIANALQSMRSAAVAAQNAGLTTEEKQALQAQYWGWVEYMDIMALTVTFDGAFLFDGAYGMTCPDPGAPAVSIPEVTPKSLNVEVLNLVSAAADAQAAIEAAQSTVSAQRATLASQQSTVAGLLP